MFYIQTGDEFRKFVHSASYTSQVAEKYLNEGRRQPDFLAVWMWTHLFVEKFKNGQNVVLDGTPRSVIEAGVMDTIFDFYKLSKPFVIHIDVSRAWSVDRLKGRKRHDDLQDEVIERRLEWYETDVEPVIAHYMGNPLCNFIKINGEQTVEQVHADILKGIGLQ